MDTKSLVATGHQRPEFKEFQGSSEVSTLVSFPKQPLHTALEVRFFPFAFHRVFSMANGSCADYSPFKAPLTAHQDDSRIYIQPRNCLAYSDELLPLEVWG